VRTATALDELLLVENILHLHAIDSEVERPYLDMRATRAWASSLPKHLALLLDKSHN